jgi:hypothetical protein
MQVSKGDTVVMMNTGKEYTLDEIGVLAPGKVQVCAGQGKAKEQGHNSSQAPHPCCCYTQLSHLACPCPPIQVDTLYCGEVGYLAAQIKSVQDARVGDTVTMKKHMAEEALPGYQVGAGAQGGGYTTDDSCYWQGCAHTSHNHQTALQPLHPKHLVLSCPWPTYRTSSPWCTVASSQSTLMTTRCVVCGRGL